MSWLLLALLASDPRAVGLDEHLGARVPDVALTATDGTRVHLRSLFDGRRPVVLVMGLRIAHFHNESCLASGYACGLR